MYLPPNLLKNSRGIVLTHFHILYETCNKKLWKNSNIAIFENEPELDLGPKTKSFLNFKGLPGKNINLRPNECINKQNNCKITAVFISGSTSKLWAGNEYLPYFWKIVILMSLLLMCVLMTSFDLIFSQVWDPSISGSLIISFNDS